MFEFLRRKFAGKASFEEQLEVVARGGISLEGAERLLGSYSREGFEAEPYRLLLCAMGDEPFNCDGAWHLDTECIEGDGSYVAIAKRMSRLGRGGLPLDEIEDSLEEGAAWLAFDIDGMRLKWDVALHDDWIDETVLSRFARLLESRRTGRRFTWTDLRGQDCLIGCATAEERKWLRDQTGLKIEWLE